MCDVQVVGAVYVEWPQLSIAYNVVWSALCLFIPLFILIVCNVCLIRAIRQSRRLHRVCRANHPSPSSTVFTAHQRITPTLIALIVVFIVCVSPSALLFSLSVYVGDLKSGSTASYHIHQSATLIANCLLLVNFAANFVLYCVVNVHFRYTARELFCCVASPSPVQLRDRRPTPLTIRQ